MSIEGKVIILTGGAGMLGREYAHYLSDRGAKIVVADIDFDAAEQVVKTFRGTPGLAVSTDVTSEQSVSHLVETTLGKFGTLDGLVNNAALDPKCDHSKNQDQFQRFESYPLELWNQELAVNLTGSFLCAQAAGRVFVKNGSGVIVNISSMYGIVAPNQKLYKNDKEESQKEFKPPTYPVSKAAVDSLTRYLATYWAGTGIRVNTLSLGGVYNNHSSEFVKRYSTHTPLQRMARKDEFCGALNFLLSQESSYMTGSNLIIDGGWSAW